KAEALIAGITAQGGMAQAVQSGEPKLAIERAAAVRQAKIDRGEAVIVGVNRYRLDAEEKIETLEVDNARVRASQIERHETLRRPRDPAQCRAPPHSSREYAARDEGNLLAAAIEAARARASLGEISQALEDVFGRHDAHTRVLSGVYGTEYDGDPQFAEAKRRIGGFAQRQGRQPSIFIAKMGQDGHDRGAKVIATAFADLGFCVHMGSL